MARWLAYYALRGLTNLQVARQEAYAAKAPKTTSIRTILALDLRKYKTWSVTTKPIFPERVRLRAIGFMTPLSRKD